MIKRTTAITFILFANILLLVQAVIPHHHHQKQICFVREHCINDNHFAGSNTNCNTHNHDYENDSNDCILKELLAFPSNQWKQEFQFINPAYDNSDNNDLQYSFLSNLTDTSIPIFYYCSSVPVINCSYSLYVSTSLGLRAPPSI